MVEFLKENSLPWIEVMSLENRLEGVILNIDNLLDWLGTVCGLSRNHHGPLTHLLQIAG